MNFTLEKPDHLAPETWEAIQSYRRRLEAAARASDAPAVLGGAKELVECVARAVMDARGVTLGDKADMPKVISEAQHALSRQAGRDLSMSSDVRAISSSTLTIALKVNEIRNQAGTGHGRSHLDETRDEVVEVVGDAAMLWCRWALRRLGHLLARDVENLIASLRSAIRRDDLQRQFDAVLMPEQPPEDQHRLGVVFGQRAAGGFGNAWAVGVSGAASLDDTSTWPSAYRLGLIEGIVIDEAGRISLKDHLTEDLINILRPVPRSQSKAALEALTVQVADATWTGYQTFTEVVEPAVIAASLRSQGTQLDFGVQSAFSKLVDALETTIVI